MVVRKKKVEKVVEELDPMFDDVEVAEIKVEVEVADAVDNKPIELACGAIVSAAYFNKNKDRLKRKV